ncbi:MAG: hypothetical protein R3E96_00280 [Planctomycetota bacterium]
MSLVMKFGGTSVGAGGDGPGRRPRRAGPAPRAAGGALRHVGHHQCAVRSGQAGRSRGCVRLARDQKELMAKHHACARALLDGDLSGGLAAQLADQFEELRILLTGVYLLRELTPRNMDHIASTGEQLSTRIFNALLTARGLSSTWMDARSILRTDRRFGSARPSKQSIAAQARRSWCPCLGPVVPWSPRATSARRKTD